MPADGGAGRARFPGLNSAFFSILAPGTHIPEHRGVTKGLITCHLGLIVPRDGDVRMRVGDRIVRWAEGETLVFDDTYDHEVWNETSGTRVVLLIQFERPLRQPGQVDRRLLPRPRPALGLRPGSARQYAALERGDEADGGLRGAAWPCRTEPRNPLIPPLAPATWEPC